MDFIVEEQSYRKPYGVPEVVIGGRVVAHVLQDNVATHLRVPNTAA
jgi:hypothetical protein